MRDRISKFLSTDGGRIWALSILILLVAVGGIALGRLVSADLLRAEAQASSRAWASGLLNSIADIPALTSGATPSPETKRLLKQASEIGNIYRYKVWNKKGELVFISDQANSPLAPMTIAQRHGQRVADLILSGSTFTEAGKGKPPEHPAFYSESYIPIKRNGEVIGVFEVYLDQTGAKALYERAFLFTEIILFTVVLIAGGVPAFMVYRRMMAHRAAQATALFLAEHDSLTGISNRKRLSEAARQALVQTEQNDTYVATLLIDLDRFKEVNDSLGHGAGDDLLQAVAGRLRSSIRGEDMVGRLGGDEFVILQVGVAQPSGATFLAKRIMRAMAEPYKVKGLQISCAASIGIAIAPTDAKEWDALLSCADAALYKSKAEGRNTVCFFERGMDDIVRVRHQTATELKMALNTDAFRLAYQPLFSCRENKVVGFEVLLRWPEGWSLRSPTEFIPVAEETGQITLIGAWVLKAACRTAASWESPLKIAVNLSPIQFRQGNIVTVVSDALRGSGLSPTRLELEVTESVWLQDTCEVVEQLTQLRGMGVSIALDDFGTGYSSLTYLWKFPFDKVKIDRSFVMGMESEPKAAAVVNSIIALGKSLELTITAEGVETEAQALALFDAGCDEAQGYYFGKPLTESDACLLASLSIL
jgi:diguanylate cyclase (GGDEF)-like protein